MTEVSTQNFGFLIAYILPGLVVLIALGNYSETVRSWFGMSSTDAPTVGGFLYVTLASVAAGMTVSTIRWLVLDSIHHATGIRQPYWHFAALEGNHTAFMTLVENHYRYYQFYGNVLVALVFLVAVRWPIQFTESKLLAFAIFALIGLFYLASRDALRKYYARAGVLLEADPQIDRRDIVTNGIGKKKHVVARQQLANEIAGKKDSRDQSVATAKPTTKNESNGR
jgi:hypothetical protein